MTNRPASCLAFAIAVSLGAARMPGAQASPASPASSSPAAPAVDASQAYVVGPKDLLDIHVLEIPELNLERRIAEDGTIDLPMLGDFTVSGLTATQVRDRLEKMLTTKYVNRANVSVVVKEYGNKPLSVVGAVQKPGSLNISGRWSLMEAISAAGGLTDRAGKTIFVIRHSANGMTDTIQVDVDDLFHGSSSRGNLPLLPGDVVNVEAKRTIRIFCLGAVRSPGALEFDTDDRLTLLSVIAKAGGFTDKASSKVLVKRRAADGKDSEIVVSYSRIVAGKDPDPSLRSDDVVIVKESFF